MVKDILISLVRKLGYRLQKDELTFDPYLLQNVDYDLLKRIKSQTMLCDPRLINIIETCKHIVDQGIEGDFIECGVWQGGGVATMAHALKLKGSFPTIHMFDAFDDICEPDAAIDGDRAVKEVGGIENAQGRLQPVQGIYKKLGKDGPGNEALVMDLLVDGVKYPSDKLRIHKGWFQDTLPLVSNGIEKVAMLRLDGDWYASTKVCLDFLYHKVVKGGVIIIDDYLTYEGCRLAVDEFLKKENVSPFKFRVNADCVCWIKE